MTDMTTSSFNNCSHIANDSALRLPGDGKFACQRSEKKCFSNISVMELPNPVYQGGKLSTGEPLDRKREYWTENFIEMLRQEHIIPKNVKVDLKPHTPRHQFCLPRGVIRLIEQESEVYQLLSFPRGVPGEEDNCIQAHHAVGRPLSLSVNYNSAKLNFTSLTKQIMTGSQANLERGVCKESGPFDPQASFRPQSISLNQYESQYATFNKYQRTDTL